MMKNMLKIAIVLPSVWIAVTLSCKKDSGNSQPVARAGKDLQIALPTCGSYGEVELNATASYDPDTRIDVYHWDILNASPDCIVETPRASITRVTGIHAGVSVFQLTVIDPEGYFTRDTITVTATGVPKEYDLDMTFNGNLFFFDSYIECYYYSYDCNYFDLTQIYGSGQAIPSGIFDIVVHGYADTSDLSDVHSTKIYFVPDTARSSYVMGELNVNLKKLIKQGGGAFSGNLTIKDGSAKYCDSLLFKNLAPLTVSGNLDVPGQKATITAKGKVYF